MANPPTHHLTINLAKKQVKDPLDLLKQPGIATKLEVAKNIDGHVVESPGQPARPRWTWLFEGTAVEAKLKRLRAVSVGAALVLKHAGRCFALTWGHSGKKHLRTDLLEDRFGLKVTLSAIPADEVKSIEHKSFDALTRNTISQGSRSGEVADFGIDIERDMLRAVLGTPKDASLGKRLYGKEALTATVQVHLADIPSKLKLYLDLYAGGGYKKDFEWIDHLAEEKSKTTIQGLDKELVHKIVAKDFDRIWLTPADVLPWQRVGQFSYAGDNHRQRYDELDILEWHGTIRDPSKLDVDGLKSRHVRWHESTSGEVGDHWSAYKALHAEIEDGKATYLLSDGKWFRITTDFVDRVNAAIDKLVVPTALPPYRQTSACGAPHREEYDYNKEIHTGDPKRYALLDSDPIPIVGGPSKFEACDLLDANKTLIHVKRYNSSKEMSHLFAQGMNSAQILLNMEEARSKTVAKLPGSHKHLIPVKSGMRAADYRVRYVIIREPSAGGATVTQRLPFFSRLSLQRAASVLRSIGMKVDVMHVDSV